MDDDERYLGKQIKLFREYTEELIEKGYHGKYVAFRDGIVLDSDTDIQALAKRVHGKYGWKRPILCDRVVRDSEKKIRLMPSPMLRRKKKD